MNISTSQTTEFALYGIWEGTSSLLGITGNILLLYTMFTYPRAIRLDLVSVTIMKNLAVVDLISALFIPSTLSVSYIGGHGEYWPMSQTWCVLYSYIKHGPAVASILFIMSFSIYRLFRCSMPLRSRDVNESVIAGVVTGLVWSLTILVPVYMMVFDVTGHLNIQFVDGDAQYGVCDFVDVLHPAQLSARPKALLALTIIIIPCIITMCTNTALLIHVIVNSVKPTIRLKTTIFVTSGFIFCYFPYGAVIFVSSTSTIVPGRVIRHLAARFVSIGCWYNFPVYLFLDKKLREFVWRMVVAASKCEKVPPPSSPMSARTRFKGAAATVAAALAMSKSAQQRTARTKKLNLETSPQTETKDYLEG